LSCRQLLLAATPRAEASPRAVGTDPVWVGAHILQTLIIEVFEAQTAVVLVAGDA